MTLRDHIVAVVARTPGITVAALEEAIRARRGTCPRNDLDSELTRARRAGLIEYRRAERGWFVVEQRAVEADNG